MLRAFSLGGGTYTGIEAVSNGVGILREPRVANGKRTMLLMATSLSFTAGGILLCYLLNRVPFESGKTLNASLWGVLTRGWHLATWDVGQPIVMFTLLSEGALLFVAAQTGFVDGPRTLAAMAVDEWVPKRFKNLSERLVTQNGVLTMGLAAALVLGYTRGAVVLLVVMYSINVFLTFTLSQFGMAKHWVQVRKEGKPWKRRLAVNAAGAETLPITGLEFSLSETTQYGSPYGVTDMSQDGFSAGALTTLAVETNGIVMARYSNGESKPAGQIELATFRNPQGLQPLGGNGWGATVAAGDPVLGVPGQGNMGVLQSGALEESNIDLTGELVSMITAQRTYQANAQTIKTQDQMLQTLVNLR